MYIAISEGHGDAALLLLKEGIDSDKKDIDGRLAIDTAPDAKVSDG
jgi:26S proteasome non-ATPase regulatory subunit 10